MVAPLYRPGDFEPAEHFYPRALNAQLHPLVRNFLNLSPDRIAERFHHLHPEAKRGAVQDALSYAPKYFRWGGCDLFVTTTERGIRRMIVVETNSCPSGQKSMPTRDEDELGGYRVLIEKSFVPSVESRRRLPSGALAVLYDKNPMEASGYAAAIAEATGEDVHLVPCHLTLDEPQHRVEDGIVEARVDGRWIPIRAALRYVTQRPWTRLPPATRTLVYNPVVSCLAGGRNKALAAKAYDLHDAELRPQGLRIRTPDTMWDVARTEIPLWVRRMGGVAVIKNPYSNAGQGVWTITSQRELESFMALEQRYDRFIVQALVGNHQWSSRGDGGRLYHVGTVPDKRGRIYAADLRFMVGAGPNGFFPVAIYARRARMPLQTELEEGASSWAMLGTNLSVKTSDGEWSTETERLLLVDSRDFNKLGVGLDDLIEGYLQTVLAISAIDRMATQILTSKQVFRRRFFRQLVPDPALVDEVMSA